MYIIYDRISNINSVINQNLDPYCDNYSKNKKILKAYKKALVECGAVD